jgi:beta-lactamase class A
MRWFPLLVPLLCLTACNAKTTQSVTLTPETPVGPSGQTLSNTIPSNSASSGTLVRTSSALTTIAPAPVVTVTQPICAALPQPVKRIAPPKPSSAITGRVGLFVGRLTRGSKDFQFDRATWLLPDGQFPLASNFKVSVLYELMRAVDAGQVKLSEKFKVTTGNQSYGRYPYDNSDVMTLAHAMIAWSDNTATDILYRRIGLATLQPISSKLNLCNTRLLLPTKAWWAAQAGYGGADFPKYALVSATRRFALAPFETQLQIAKRLDAAAQKVSAETLRKALDFGYFAGRNGGVETMSQIDRQIQNVSTPHEWARVVHRAFVNPSLSPKTAAMFRAVMSHGRVPFNYFGGKSGNTARVLTYSGYLETLSGDRVIYVYFNDSSQNLITRDETPQAFKLINTALRLVMRPEDLTRPKVVVSPRKP